MCLSTPTTKQTSDDNSSVSTAACSASSPCVNGANVACNLTPKTQFDCNGNEKSTTISSITRRKTAQTTDINQNSIAKDLCDTLGYSEENAVYKEKQKTKEMQTANSAVTNDVQPAEFKPEIRWPDLAAQLFLHLGAFYGIYLLFSANSYTWIWSLMVLWASGIGITAGAHRLWSHKSYHASLPLRIFLIFLFTIAGQRDAYTWALDHRIHHKFSETEADPHNAKRGFWFAHVGWLFLTPHPMVAEKRKVIDMSDLENDKVVMFQRKWFIPLFAVISLGVPVLVPWYYWDESLWQSFWICFNLRFTSTLNVAFLVNSLAHLWGSKPYDKNISPVDSPLVSFLAFGEGWHNYHHVFPWDYKTGEFGSYRLNTTTAFIDLCARLGLATGRKFVSPDMIKRRALKCGDGSRFLSDEYAHKDQVWGFGDRDIPKDDLHELKRMNS